MIPTLPLPTLTQQQLKQAWSWPKETGPDGRPRPGTPQGIRHYLAAHGPVAVTYPVTTTGLEHGLDAHLLQVDVLGRDEAEARAAARQVRVALCGQGGRRPGAWRFGGAQAEVLSDDTSVRLILTFTRTTYEPGL